jgi:hypothetical protein
MSTPAPTIGGFDATPNIIGLGESSILKWSVTGTAETVDIEPGIGVVALSGSREVTPSATINYTLTAKNKDQVKTATLHLVVGDKKSSPESGDKADNSSASNAPVAAAPAASVQAPNVIIVTVPAANTQSTSAAATSTPATSVPASDVEATISNEPAADEPESDLPASSVPAISAPSANTNAVSVKDTSAHAVQASSVEENAVSDEDLREAEAQSSDLSSEPGTFATTTTASQPGSDVNVGASAVSAEAASTSQSGAVVSIGGGSQSGVKEISSADWNPSTEASSSLSEMSQEAPINSKLKSSGHQPGQSSGALGMGSASSVATVSESQSPDPLSMGSASPDVSISELP